MPTHHASPPRVLRPSDAPALLPLVQGLAAHHGEHACATADTLARDLCDGWLWGFGMGVPLRAYALLLPHGRAQFGERGAMLHHIYVAPEARRQGMARALVTACEIDAKAKGCSYLLIAAHEGNDAARDVYSALGYDWRAPTFWRFSKSL